MADAPTHCPLVHGVHVRARACVLYSQDYAPSCALPDAEKHGQGVCVNVVSVPCVSHAVCMGPGAVGSARVDSLLRTLFFNPDTVVCVCACCSAVWCAPVTCEHQLEESVYTHTNKVCQQSVLHFPVGIVFDPDCWSMPVAPVSQEVIDVIHRGDYDALAYSREELLLHWFVMFQELDFFNRFKINPETLHYFFLTVGNTYRDNKYHNFHHAIEVTQFVFYFTQHSKGALHKELNDVALLSLLVAAVVRAHANRIRSTTPCCSRGTCPCKPHT